MGIRKFDLLKKNALTVCINDLCGGYVIVDASNILSKFVFGIKNHHTDSKFYIVMLFRFIIFLRKYKIYPIFIFDGDTSLIKKIHNREKAIKRILVSSNYQQKIAKYDIGECKKLLDLMGVPYYQAQGSADAQCAALSKYNKNILGVFTEDTDILLHGGSKIYRHFSFKNRNVQSLTGQTVLSNINNFIAKIRSEHFLCPMTIKKKKLVEIAILIGASNNKACDIITDNKYKLLEKYILCDCDIFNLINTISLENSKGQFNYVVPLNFIENFFRAYREYREVDYYDIQCGNFKCNPPNVSYLSSYLHDVGVYENFIDYGIDVLKASIKYYESKYN